MGRCYTKLGGNWRVTKTSVMNKSKVIPQFTGLQGGVSRVMGRKMPRMRVRVAKVWYTTSQKRAGRSPHLVMEGGLMHWGR